MRGLREPDRTGKEKDWTAVLLVISIVGIAAVGVVGVYDFFYAPVYHGVGEVAAADCGASSPTVTFRASGADTLLRTNTSNCAILSAHIGGTFDYTYRSAFLESGFLLDYKPASP